MIYNYINQINYINQKIIFIYTYIYIYVIV